MGKVIDELKELFTMKKEKAEVMDENVFTFPKMPPVPPKEPKKVYINKHSLTIDLHDTSTLGWSYEVDEKDPNAVGPVDEWADFINWFTKMKTTTYTMQHRDGQTTFCRRDIRSFTIHSEKHIEKKT